MINISFGSMKKPLTTGMKRIFFLYFLFFWSLFLFLIAAVLNSGLDALFSQYSLVLINGTIIPRASVEIAPVVEEIIKLLGYSILFFIPLSSINKLEYHSKKEFLDKMLFPAFLISAGVFGFFEGFIHNLGFNKVCFIAFFSLNTLIHITYSIYPFILGRKYRNRFYVFLPIAMLLHATHNFILNMIWDNKWVTFAMVTIFLVPLVFLERNNLAETAKRLLPIITERVILVAFVIIYVYIFLCCLLAF